MHDTKIENIIRNKCVAVIRNQGSTFTFVTIFINLDSVVRNAHSFAMSVSFSGHLYVIILFL